MAKNDIYQIRVRGLISERWSDWFDGLTVENEERSTILTGSIGDQAALFGVLHRIDALNLTIVSVIRMSPDQNSEATGSHLP